MGMFFYLPDTNIGEMICKHLKKTGKPKAYLGKKLNMTTSNLNRLLKKESLNTKWIEKISEALEYNFFAELCNDTEHVRTGYELTHGTLGKAISRRLKEFNMNQAELASKIGVWPREICRIISNSSTESARLISISRELAYNFFQEFYTTESQVVDDKDVSSGSITLLDRFEQLVIANDNLRKENIKLRSELYETQQRLSAASNKM